MNDAPLDADNERPDAEAEALNQTQALVRAARLSLGEAEDAAVGLDDPPTRQLASEAAAAVERLGHHLVDLEQDGSHQATARVADPALAERCHIEGCGAAATQLLVGADGGRIAVCDRCGEELKAVLP